MNQTGVASTGSRRQAFRKRPLAGSRGADPASRSRGADAASVTNGDAEQIARERHQLLEPERLVTQLGSERLDLRRLRVVQVVVAGDDRHWRIGEAGNRTDGAEKLQP